MIRMSPSLDACARRPNRREALRWLAACAGAVSGASRATSAAALDDEEWRDEARDRMIPVRLRWPAGDAPCAVVLHSHGLGGSRAGAGAWGEAWAAAGFAVLHLQHPGSDREIWRGRRLAAVRHGASVEQYLARVGDAHFALDELQRRVAQAVAGSACAWMRSASAAIRLAPG
jgi:predicted dienelactone hydrolase